MQAVHATGKDRKRRRAPGGTGKIRMTDDWKKTVHRNKLLGMWAAEKLGITGQDGEDYSDTLAVGTLDPERSDVTPQPASPAKSIRSAASAGSLALTCSWMQAQP